MGHGLQRKIEYCNPPLSKEIFLQERGLADDHWEDEAYVDQEDWSEDDEADEDS